ncbi:Rpn family recombination-promoting nuclease/putative transposase [Clostridium weizhouense]|uniref:Rpn family recombination-promoting nuclease/putative transposase n=1 Tax=Clostridium weizhouense TaxID=2859781 RepID=A0ABS7AJ92_9CLOT|nr:Rpn family recombination-promoting nuclease/putative transposase [Clostridium weizhouense]MBW6408743.1 Rpn family recombination-promoting nuclease/putative transposase [Clostridium weizhouense]
MNRMLINIDYNKLKKYIVINIIDFECILVNKIHTTYHIIEDETGYKLTDVLEVHFLETPKLKRAQELKDINDSILDWLEFIDAKSKEGMKMLAEKNENIKTAYEILERASKSKEARMAYEARQAEIMDQMTREKTAREEGLRKGIEQGIEKGKIENARSFLLLGVDIEKVAKGTGLSIDFVKKLKDEMN